MPRKSKKVSNSSKNKTRRTNKKVQRITSPHNINAERITPRYSGISALYKSIYGPRRPSALFY
jgi:hypothetical protein